MIYIYIAPFSIFKINLYPFLLAPQGGSLKDV